jgi:hypothetical protein
MQSAMKLFLEPLAVACAHSTQHGNDTSPTCPSFLARMREQEGSPAGTQIADTGAANECSAHRSFGVALHQF